MRNAQRIIRTTKPGSLNKLMQHYHAWRAVARLNPNYTQSFVDYLIYEWGYIVPEDLGVDTNNITAFINALSLRWGLTPAPE